MRKRLIALLVITPLLLSSQLSTSHAAAKAGAKCNKAGITSVASGKTFTCVKTGKKLAWNKGVKVAQPIKNDLSQRWEKTGSKATKFFNVWTANLATGKPETQITYWFGATVPPEIKAEAERRMNNTVLQWERFYKVSRSKVYFDLAMLEDHGARCEVLSKRSVHFAVDWCLGHDPRKTKYFYWASVFESEGGYRPTLDPMLSKDASKSHSYTLFEPAVMYTDSFMPRIEHEWFHQIQYDLTGNNYLAEYPLWFKEGSPEYFGLLDAAGRDQNYFIQHRAQGWRTNNVEISVNYFKEWITTASEPAFFGPRTTSGPGKANPNGSDNQYRRGELLTEWMVGKIGVTGLIKLMKDTESVGWQKAFKNNMGASPDELLTEMATYLYTENKIIKDNSWILLPRCKSYASHKVIEVNKGVCFSGDGTLN
jgi:hypothetical protein